MDADLATPPLVQPRVVLRIDDLRKRYGRVDVLRGLFLTAHAGEVYGFLGRNGAGKSTTLRTLVGIQQADGGSLEMLGERMVRPSRHHKQRLGYVSQEPNFYPWMSARRLGAFVGPLYPSWDTAEFDRLLDVLDVPPDRRVSALSNGTRAKLGLALALAHRPRLLILDEPTAGLDAAARREFLELVSVQARQDGRATIFSSHIVEEVERVADRIGVLHAGRLVYEGPIEPLRAAVKRVRWPVDPGAPTEPTMPAGFVELQRRTYPDRVERVLRAEPEQWAETDLAGAHVSSLSLEDIFLALSLSRPTE